MDSEPLTEPPPDAHCVEYAVPNDLAVLRDIVGRHAQAAGLSEDKTAALMLAVNELASNTIEHTDDGGSLRIWIHGGALVCQIEDRGRLEAAIGRSMPSEPGSRGYGLPLVTRLTDHAVCLSGPAGTRWQLRMRLKGFRPGRLDGAQHH
ncbi:ATP-binding protein [Allorhizocola rhizosphaerae]|uniref:ATP-binding protein n=1 Tax=Allorhizocola rhizosphaerae TaxID=1872709 RepID=UPI000E3DED00|nr:ATP-binding protein [Allorhizocola rhizosphaerae]